MVSFVAFCESLPKEIFTEDNQENEDSVVLPDLLDSPIQLQWPLSFPSFPSVNPRPKEIFTEDNKENEDLAKIQGKLLY